MMVTVVSLYSFLFLFSIIRQKFRLKFRWIGATKCIKENATFSLKLGIKSNKYLVVVVVFFF